MYITLHTSRTRSVVKNYEIDNKKVILHFLYWQADHLNQISCLSVENYEIDNKKGFCIDLCQFLYLQAEHVSAII